MKIFLVTSTRADFGLFKNLILEFNKSNYFDLKIIATGTHFSKKHGYSYSEIKKSNTKVFKKIFISNKATSPKYLLDDIGVLSKNIFYLIKKNKPDLFILLGDRYEIFAVAISAYISRIPIAHIHGGEVTQGSLDDGYRHSISKFSNIHFVSNKIYRKRLIQLGENPKSIFNVGSLGVENISKTKFITEKDLERELKIKLKKKILLVCLHPEITKNQTIKLVQETLTSLKYFKDNTIIFTLPGADLFNDIIFAKIRKFVKNFPNSYLFKTLGSQRFLSLLKIADVMIGNSSSGILEVPVFKKPTINIGDRQKGREISSNVLNVRVNRFEIKKKINFIFSKKFNLRKIDSTFKRKNTSKLIINILKRKDLNNYKTKEFYNINF